MKINEIYKNAKTYGVPVIRTESHKILEEIVSKVNPKHILEIGMAVGYSGITMLEASTANLITIEHNEDFIKQAKKNFKSHNLSKRVKILEGDCLVEISKLLSSENFNEYFDFIFLDGPKAQYNLMFEGLLKLLAKGGTLVADNVLFRGYVEGETEAPTKRYKTIIKRLNTFIENAKNNPQTATFELKNTEDGIIILTKR